MDLRWDDERTRQFVTNAWLITSNGPYGDNIMSAEWTHHVSYSPSLIAVCIGPHKATAANIEKSGEFGVNLASEKQNVISSVAGGNSGKECDKVAALEELGFEFYKARKIDTVMVKGAAMNAECVLKNKIVIGDHVMFVGEVVEISADIGVKPITYHQGKYWKAGENAEKPSDKELERIRSVVEKHGK